ncbi:MAG: hypothetical protein AAF804_15195, partial [Bacteroidota bacterium]
SLDMWGLNSPQLATELPSPELLAEWRPSLSLIHPAMDWDTWQQEAQQSLTSDKNWVHMCHATLRYLQATGHHEAWALTHETEAPERGYTCFYQSAAWAYQLQKDYLAWRGKASEDPIRWDFYFIDCQSKLYPDLRSIMIQQGGRLLTSPSPTCLPTPPAPASK